jgi:predicted DNA-binding transcriptional regulator AlpA
LSSRLARCPRTGNSDAEYSPHLQKLLDSVADVTAPKRLHLDKRAAELIEEGVGRPDDLLSTPELARWLGVSVQWCQIARHRGGGPPWVKLSPRRVRYLRSEVWEWLDQRRRTSTRD